MSLFYHAAAPTPHPHARSFGVTTTTELFYPTITSIVNGALEWSDLVSRCRGVDGARWIVLVISNAYPSACKHVAPPETRSLGAFVITDKGTAAIELRFGRV